MGTTAAKTFNVTSGRHYIVVQQSSNDDGNKTKPNFTVTGAEIKMNYSRVVSMNNGINVVKYGIFIVKATSSVLTMSNTSYIAQID